MLAWYDDIKVLTETTGEERNAYVRGHSRSFSSVSARSVSSFDDDEADRIPFNISHRSSVASGANGEVFGAIGQESKQTQRPAGGRFPSDLQIRRDGLTRGLTPSSDGSEVNQDITTAAGGLDGFTDCPRMATASHVNGNSSISHATRRGPAYDTPAPIMTASLQGQKAEFMMTTPITPDAGASLNAPTRQLQKPPVESFIGSSEKTIVASGVPAPASRSPPEKMAAVESNAWLHASEPLSYIDGATTSRPQTAMRDLVEDPIEAKASAATMQEFPNMRRNDTGNSISNLHVPGEYPKGAQS
jgi:hypothetical protein